MKKLFYTFAWVLAAPAAFGQAITIGSAKPITLGGIDSCAVPTAAALAALPSLGTPSNNATWDLSSVAVQSSFVTYAYRPKTSGFSTATYSDSTTYRLAPSSAASYKAWRNIQQAPGAVFIQGEEILTRQAKSISGTTGNGIDSIIFPTQVISYNPKQLRIIKFPATIGTVWIDSTSRNLNFNLTVTAASLANAPCDQRQRRISIDSVVGWGSMKVPIVGKMASTSMGVLQVHHYDIAIDSYFVNGSPASAAALTALGGAQGQSTIVARTYFYRANATRPLIELVHATPSHRSSASTFYIHAADLEEATGVPAVQAANCVRLYPNPVTAGGHLTIMLPGNLARDWQYTIVNAVGRIVAQDRLRLSNAMDYAALNMPQGITAGTYYLYLNNDIMKMLAVQVTVK